MYKENHEVKSTCHKTSINRATYSWARTIYLQTEGKERNFGLFNELENAPVHKS